MTDSTVTLSFYGAAGTVTGSRYLLEGGTHRILVDCGLFQGYKYLREKNWQQFPVKPSSIDAIFLTHAHLDHSGYIPALVKQGFCGPIICTQATSDLCEILLLDTAHIQEEEAFYRNRHKTSKHQPAQPLYTTSDVKKALKLFAPIESTLDSNSGDVQYQDYRKDDLSVKFHPNGHILGSTYLEVTVAGKTLVFSGDLGRPHDLIMKPPSPPSRCDYLIIESTYGNRLHDNRDLHAVVSDIICETVSHGGSVLIPTFAVGRAQVMMYLLQQLRRNGDIPFLPIYLDSPMAIDASELLMRHHSLHRLSNEECQQIFREIYFTRTVEQSMALNNMQVPSIILAASGMATGGRVLHHLKRMLGNHKNTVLFAGYQAGGTRGARLVAGTKQIKIHGQYHTVKASIQSLEFMSAHADQEEIINWIKKLPCAPKRCFITHGEPEAADVLRLKIHEELGWSCHVSQLNESVTL